MHHNRFQSWEVSKIMAREKRYGGKWLMLSMGEAMWAHFYHRVIDHLGGLTHRLVDQKELARLAGPFYNRFARGGEGHLEVGKNVYYTVHHLAHMVLALKPFGCMPSSQSDGVQSAVINKFRDMIFLPIETSGEGEVNAHSRVQMALGEAKAKAKGEFEVVLKSTGKRLEDIKGLRRRSSRAEAALLPRSAPPRHRRHGRAIRFARQRSDEPEESLLAGSGSDSQTQRGVGISAGAFDKSAHGIPA